MIVGEEGILIKDLYYVLMKAGFGNVKECKTLIKHRFVFVNDELVEDCCYQVCSHDKICVDKHSVKWPFIYYMLNKPQGYLSATYDSNEHYVLELIDHKDCFCLGRLDRDTTGLLILTNDVSLKPLLLPDNHVDKKYWVEVNEVLNENIIDAFQKGVVIDQNYICHSSKLELIDKNTCYVTIDEGKYHQIKKMFLSYGYVVKNLKRVSFGNLVLDQSLQVGEARLLKENEFQFLEKQLNEIKSGI